jgi:hypothetical protein
VRPGPDLWHNPQTSSRETLRPDTDGRGQALVSLNEEQWRLISALQTQQHGMTMRQLETRLLCSRGQLEQLLESLLERQLVARLNTVIPSYAYRYGGVDLDTE